MGEQIVIDGSMGEGGGQILRSALALSLVTGKPCRIEKIRAGRKKPGLLRQHLTALEAATEVGRAGVTGAEIGSARITFEPTTISAGEYRFAIGTAGSTTLVLQTILPALLLAPKPSHLVLEGGTHNPLAPPFDFLQKAFLPILGRMGARCEATLDCPGFYPAGGGKMQITVQPSARLAPLELLSRGEMVGRKARAIVANLPRHIAERELNAVRKKVSWPDESFQVEEVRECHGPGNILLIELQFENVIEVFTAFGEKGIPAEAVADQAVECALKYLKTNAVAGPHLADQLLLPFAIAGAGAFTTMPLTRHSSTNIEVIGKFLDIGIEVEHREDRTCLVRIA